jgi:citrate synthase
MPEFKPGLEGVIAFETEIAEPDKQGGALRYRGVDIEELVGHVSYGHVWGLLVDNAFAGAAAGRALSDPGSFR